VRKQINPNLQIGGIVFNMVDSRTREHRENMQLLRDSYGNRLNIFETTIPFSVRVKECGKAGESIYQYDAKGKAAAAFEQLAGEVLAYGS
jgi:chromosome partitioning protein